MVDLPVCKTIILKMLTIKSRSHEYSVEEFQTLSSALRATDRSRAHYLVDHSIIQYYNEVIASETELSRTVLVEASEENKAFERLTPIFLELLEKGLKRDGVLIVIGGGVLQDIGCFIASVLFRGLRWELVPTTLLAQADSCIGSKSSINIGSYKNQIGTFYPPYRVLLTPQVLQTLPFDEIRSGLGEVIKLQLLNNKDGFEELMDDLNRLSSDTRFSIISKWVQRSMEVKKPYIEQDEYDRGVRNLLNYGHTFGHAFESASHYGIPHGIAVILGMLTATYLSSRLGLVATSYYEDLKQCISPWCHPYGDELLKADREAIFKAIRQDKKNTSDSVNCILTRGAGRMEKIQVDFSSQLVPAVDNFINERRWK